MSYIFQPSLEKIALVKISSTLWKQDVIRESIADSSLCIDSNEGWKKLEEKVICKVQELSLPELLKEKLSGCVRSMGLEILKWLNYHCTSNIARYLYLRLHTPTEFSWTPHGTIDKKETARLIIEDQTVDFETRYKLAYMYCLADDTQKIWNTLPEDYERRLHRIIVNPGVINEHDLQCFWRNLNAPFSRRQNGPGYQIAFRNAIRNNNEVAAKYFLQKLTPDEREICLVESAHYVHGVEVQCFLLSQMNEEQRKIVFQTHPKSATDCFVQWPWFDFLVETANRMWDSLPTTDVCLSPLLTLVIRKEYSGYEYAIYQKLFRQLWQCACIRFGADACASELLLANLFCVKDRENIRLVLQDSSPNLRKGFIFGSTGLSISLKLMRENEWEYLLFVVRQCLTSELEIKEYREELKKWPNGESNFDLASKIDEVFITQD